MGSYERVVWISVISISEKFQFVFLVLIIKSANILRPAFFFSKKSLAEKVWPISFFLFGGGSGSGGNELIVFLKHLCPGVRYLFKYRLPL